MDTTLINGDCFDYLNNIQDNSVDLLLTDPPYNVDYEGGTKDRLKIQNDKMKTDDFYTFLLEFSILKYKSL